MKTQLTGLLAATLLLAAIGAVLAQGTAFTYQGRLNSGGSPANGTVNISNGTKSMTITPPTGNLFFRLSNP